MFYYQFNIGDYASHTKHLSPIEDLAYRRMLDIYYTSEKPLQGDENSIARLVGLRENIQEVTNVLADFFQKTKLGYVNKRCDADIDTYHKYLDKQKENGKKGGRPKTQTKPTANPSLTQTEPKITLTNNQEPLTNNQDKTLTSTSVDNIEYHEIINLYNSILPELPQVKNITPKRRSAMRTCANTKPRYKELAFWEYYFKEVRNVDFLMGKKTDFKADFDFLVTHSKFIKIIEGGYK